MRQPSSPLPLVSVAKAVAGTVMIAVLMLILPLAPVVLAPFLALPVAYVVARHGRIGGAIVAAFSAVLLYFAAGAGAALLIFVITGGAGLALGWALRSGWRFSRTLAVVALSLLAGVVVYGLV